MNISAPMVIPENRQLTIQQQRANFTKDRNDFERAMAHVNTKAPEYFSQFRTDTGYNQPQLHDTFCGWRLKCEEQRERIHSTLVKPEPVILEPTQFLGTVQRTPTVWWADTEFKAPSRQDHGVTTGYVLVQGRDWPQAVALNHGQIVYERSATGSQADYVDIVCIGSFDVDDNGFQTAMLAAEEYTLNIMSNRYVHVKTHLSLPAVREGGGGPIRCELVRLMVTHEEFLADQARGFYE